MIDISKEDVRTAYRVIQRLEYEMNKFYSTHRGIVQPSFDEDGWQMSAGKSNSLTVVRNMLANKIAFDETKE